MKKICMILSLIGVVLSLLTGCEEKNISFDELYYIIPRVRVETGDGSGFLPGKLNVITGDITPICADPLCTHAAESDCAFARALYTFPNSYQNGWFYFIKTFDASPENQKNRFDRLMRYGISDMRLEEVYVLPKESSYSFELTGGAFYYKGKSSGIHVVVDLANGEVSEFTSGMDVPVGAYEGGTVYRTEDNASLWCIDQKGQRTELVTEGLIGSPRLEGDRLFWRMDGQIVSYDMKKLREVGRFSVDLHFADDYTADGEMIYYLKKVKNPPLLGHDLNEKREVYNTTGGEIWRYDYRTGIEERLCSMPEVCFDCYSTRMEVVGEHLVLGYSITDYSDYTEVEDKFGTHYQYAEESGFCVLHTSTGEITLINFNSNDGFTD